MHRERLLNSLPITELLPVPDAAFATSDSDFSAPGTDLSFQGMIQSRKLILENQQALFKDYDLNRLLKRLFTVLELMDLENVQKQFHRFFDKKDSLWLFLSF